MHMQIIIVISLNMIIAVIGTLAYAVRIVGIRTGKIAVSYSLFNILILISRTSITFQLPLLTKFVEKNPKSGDLYNIFILILLSTFAATILGAFLIPTFQRIFTKMVSSFSVDRSMGKLLLHIFSKNGIKNVIGSITLPVKENITKLNLKNISFNILFFNIITVALLTVGTLAPIYAGSIEPSLRATCITLSAIINGFATVLMTIFIDPYLSAMTDDVVLGKCSESLYRTNVVGMVVTRIMGSFISIFLLIPAAHVIALMAKMI